jgi:plastocyanin
VVAEPAGGAPRPQPGQKAIMDQRDLSFVPDVLVVQTGTAVDFPNSDQVRHQVYSFSPAKTFQLALYAGRAHAPVVFDKAGLVTLGCNIHDSMVGYIYVTDSPWFAFTGADGSARLHGLAPGDYTVRIWHALLDESGPQLSTHLHLAESVAGNASFRLTHPLRRAPQHHGADKRWADY